MSSSTSCSRPSRRAGHASGWRIAHAAAAWASRAAARWKRAWLPSWPLTMPWKRPAGLPDASAAIDRPRSMSGCASRVRPAPRRSRSRPVRRRRSAHGACGRPRRFAQSGCRVARSGGRSAPANAMATGAQAPVRATSSMQKPTLRRACSAAGSSRRAVNVASGAASRANAFAWRGSRDSRDWRRPGRLDQEGVDGRDDVAQCRARIFRTDQQLDAAFVEREAVQIRRRRRQGPRQQRLQCGIRSASAGTDVGSRSACPDHDDVEPLASPWIDAPGRPRRQKDGQARCRRRRGS